MKNSRGVLNSPRLNEIKKKKNIVLRKKVIVTVFLVLVIFLSLGFISRREQINISNIRITGNKIIESKDINEIIAKNLEGNYLWIFPKKNFLLYPKNKIKNELVLTFKRIREISLTVKNTNTLEVNLSEKKATYTWCGENLPELDTRLEDAKCYFMDNSGYIFDEAPYFSGEVYFRFFGHASTATTGEEIDNNMTIPMGFSFINDKFAQFISFIDNLSKMDLSPIAMLVKKDGDVEIYLSSDALLVNSPKIIFKSGANLTEITENLQAAVNVEPLKTDLVRKYSSLLYIDLRFNNKVYYKFDE